MMPAVAQQEKQDRLLHVQAVFRLIEHNRARRIYHRIGDLVTTMGGQAVHEKRMVSGEPHQLFVDLVGSENLATLRRFSFLPHAGPDIGVNGVGLGHGCDWVVGNVDASAGGRGVGFCDRYYFSAGFVARGSCDGEDTSEQRGSEHQRVRDIVAVTDEREMDIAHVAELLAQSEEIGERLAGMFEIAERVDDGYARMLGHLLDGGVLEGAQDNAIDPALEVMGDIAELFTGIEAVARVVHEKRGAAQARHAGLKCQASAQRGLLEKHGELLAEQRAAEVLGAGLHHVGEVEDGAHVGGRKIANGNEVVEPHAGREMRDRGAGDALSGHADSLWRFTRPLPRCRRQLSPDRTRVKLWLARPKECGYALRRDEVPVCKLRAWATCRRR